MIIVRMCLYRSLYDFLFVSFLHVCRFRCMVIVLCLVVLFSVSCVYVDLLC